MPNFNTTTMKVAIYPVRDKMEQHPLPKESIEKLKALIVYCIKREQNLTVVVSFNQHYIDNAALIEIEKVFKANKVKVHTDELGLLVFFTEAAKMITLKLEGGSGQFLQHIAKKADRTVKKHQSKHTKDDEDDDIEDASGMGLTQECAF